MRDHLCDSHIAMNKVHLQYLNTPAQQDLIRIVRGPEEIKMYSSPKKYININLRQWKKINKIKYIIRLDNRGSVK